MEIPISGSNVPWHYGTHPWAEHDGYERHQHSLNGVLTILPNDTRLHFPPRSESSPAGDNLKDRKIIYTPDGDMCCPHCGGSIR